MNRNIYLKLFFLCPIITAVIMLINQLSFQDLFDSSIGFFGFLGLPMVMLFLGWSIVFYQKYTIGTQYLEKLRSAPHDTMLRANLEWNINLLKSKNNLCREIGLGGTFLGVISIAQGLAALSTLYNSQRIDNEAIIMSLVPGITFAMSSSLAARALSHVGDTLTSKLQMKARCLILTTQANCPTATPQTRPISARMGPAH
ncbi:MAG: hypothetical protein HQL69_12235 [Magnetococcales bacterium]|nr:hypothetical protein [Magnetococcales bacterium]